MVEPVIKEIDELIDEAEKKKANNKEKMKVKREQDRKEDLNMLNEKPGRCPHTKQPCGAMKDGLVIVRPSLKVDACPHCEGRGFDVVMEDDGDRQYPVPGDPCLKCNGTGKRPHTNPCTDCPDESTMVCEYCDKIDPEALANRLRIAMACAHCATCKSYTCPVPNAVNGCDGCGGHSEDCKNCGEVKDDAEKI